MSIGMPTQSALVPEPDPKSNEEEELPNVRHFQVDAESSSEEDNDENELENDGYEPLPMIDGVDAIDISSDEETTASTLEEPQMREIAVNTDLVKTTMKGIKLDESSIPAWAKDISDTAWDSFIKQTLSKETDTSSHTTQPGSSSQT